MNDTLNAARADGLPDDFLPPRKKNLGRLTRRILRHMSTVILPRNERLQVDRHDEIVNFIDNYVPFLPPLFRLGFPIGVWILEIGAIFLGGRLLPFSMLSPQRQERYIDGWARSNLWWRRDLLKGIKAIMMIGFFELPEVHKFINYDQAEHVAFVTARRATTYAKEI